MEFYNRIMTYVWLIAGIAIFIVSTYMSITDDIKKWGFYYIFSLVAFMMFFMKRWMVKRMQKHIQYLEDQKKSAQ
jgi:quinol-cytochrome oxidoreductase complex cytochrome b subunit